MYSMYVGQHLYADDTQIYVSLLSPNDHLSLEKLCLQNASLQMVMSKLNLDETLINPNKTVLILISKTQRNFRTSGRLLWWTTFQQPIVKNTYISSSINYPQIPTVIVSQPGSHIVPKKGVMAYLCYKQTNLRNVFSNYPRTIPGWLTLFYLSPFGRKTHSRWPLHALTIMLKMVYLH